MQNQGSIIGTGRFYFCIAIMSLRIISDRVATTKPPRIRHEMRTCVRVLTYLRVVKGAAKAYDAVVTFVLTREGTMTRLKLTKIGNSVGAVFPRELLARLHAEAGDTVYLTESPDGARLTPYNPNFAGQMKAAESIMKKRRSVLRELAK